MNLTPTELQVLRHVNGVGAILARQLRERYGPETNWGGLLAGKLLELLPTEIGQVARVTPRGYTELDTRGLTPRSLLSGPSTLVDRAFQQAAIQVVSRQGYQPLDLIHKRMPDGQTGRQIIRIMCRAPDVARLESQWGRGKAYDHDNPHVAVLGHPAMYASISGGGIDVRRVRKLVTLHWHDIHNWRHPVLIAVPEETQEMRSYLRSIHTRSRREWEKPLPGMYAPPPWYPQVQLVLVPLPEGHPGRVKK